MFAEFLNRLIQPAPAPLGDDDARLALSALLVRLARSDGAYTADEKSHIDTILSTRYGLSAEAAQALRSDAEQLEAEAPDTVRFTRAIKDTVPYEERVGVVEALWQVALADGSRDASEDALIRMAAKFLGLTDIESASARKRVANAGD